MSSAIVTVMLMAGMAGCADDGADAADTVAGEPIAVVSLDDGSYAEFHVPEPDGLLVFAQGTPAAEIEHLRPAELYEALTGTAPPPALRAAQDRADRARAARPPRESKLDAAAGQSSLTGPADGTASLTASTFRARYCNQGGFDFDFCWLDRTTSITFDVPNAALIDAHLDVVAGSVVFSLQRRNIFGGWDLLRRSTVRPSATITTFTSENIDILPDNYRVSVTAGDGDRYHLAIRGDN